MGDSGEQTVIPDYELIRLIGTGSYGDVWLARGVTGAFRAVKVVHRSRFAHQRPYEREFEGITRFARVSLQEPSQLALLHVGRGGEKFFYYVMELADDATTGRVFDPKSYVPCTLMHWAKPEIRRSTAAVIDQGVALARALSTLHEACLVHRDIKPTNVIFVGGVPKLADVGLVAEMSEGHTFIGTEGYVAPEGPGAASADVYSLGKVLYEVATGMDRKDWPRLPSDLAERPDRQVLLELNEVLLRACERDPRRRFQDARELLDDLLLLQAGRSVRRLRRAERQLRGTVRMVAVLTLIAAIAGGGAWVERRRADQEMNLRQRAEAERDALARKTVYTATLARASEALGQGDYGRARDILSEAAPTDGHPDLRGFEWRALDHFALGDPCEVLTMSGSAALRIRLAPSGDGRATFLADRTINIGNGEKGASIYVHGANAFADYSADGAWLVGIESGGHIARWDAKTGLQAAGTSPKADRLLGIRPTGQYAVYLRAGENNPLVVRNWDFSKLVESSLAEVPKDTEGRRWDYYRGAISPDGQKCALALISGRVQAATWKVVVLDLTHGTQLYCEQVDHRPTALAFSPDSRLMATAWGDSAQVGMLNVESKTWLWTANCGAGQVDTIEFGRVGDLLCVGGRESLIYILKAGDGSIANVLHGNGGGVTAVAWGRTGHDLFSGSGRGEIRYWGDWAIRAPFELTGLWRPLGGGRMVCLSKDGRYLAATDDPKRGTLVVQTADLSIRHRIAGMLFPLGIDGNALLGVRDTGTLERRSFGGVAEGSPTVVSLQRMTSVSPAMDLSADFETLAVADTAGNLLFWDIKGGRDLGTNYAHHGAIYAVALSNDGNRAVSVGGDQFAVIWDVRRNRALSSWPASAYCVSIDNRHDLVALGLADGGMEIRRLSTGDLIKQVRTDSALIQSISFSPDGSRLVGGGARGAMHFFTTDDWREVLDFRIPIDPNSHSDSTVSSIRFSADGMTLAAYLNDGRVCFLRAGLSNQFISEGRLGGG